jgi:hypothetical protein
VAFHTAVDDFTHALAENGFPSKLRADRNDEWYDLGVDDFHPDYDTGSGSEAERRWRMRRDSINGPARRVVESYDALMDVARERLHY